MIRLLLSLALVAAGVYPSVGSVQGNSRHEEPGDPCDRVFNHHHVRDANRAESLSRVVERVQW